MNPEDYKKKLDQWESEGYEVYKFRQKWFPAKKGRIKWWWLSIAIVIIAVVSGVVGWQISSTGKSNEPLPPTITTQPTMPLPIATTTQPPTETATSKLTEQADDDYSNQQQIAEEIMVSVSISEFGEKKHRQEEILISEGDMIKVSLGSNPSTGFSWDDEAQISDTGILYQTSHEYIEGYKLRPDMVGVPGNELWTFETLKKGTATVSMEYSRLLGAPVEGEWTYEITVTVK